MALSPGAGSAIAGGIQAVGSFFIGRSQAKAAKSVAEAQKSLIRLQAEEQRIRNRILSQSLDGQDARLPFELSSPSGEGYGTTVLREGEASRQAEVKTAGLSGGLTLLLLGAAIFLLRS